MKDLNFAPRKPNSTSRRWELGASSSGRKPALTIRQFKGVMMDNGH
jgi:hypothetical protein